MGCGLECVCGGGGAGLKWFGTFVLALRNVHGDPNTGLFSKFIPLLLSFILAFISLKQLKNQAMSFIHPFIQTLFLFSETETSDIRASFILRCT